ncbi:hypothetical protein LTR37_003027 [Vermiconidia calcicola]|uniref:Uncharacterized protein n=1 Tax=Vermiconidia calcicola TaxID=1690605 RepID=A0ACC3NQP4_9PEZI|nr:hypothetical protein LTR37_003027 [Vermiconidia calcicola]
MTPLPRRRATPAPCAVTAMRSCNHSFLDPVPLPMIRRLDNDVPSVQHAWKPREEAEKDVDEEVGADASPEDDGRFFGFKSFP